VARKILVADLLCGAGGSSTGCARALNDLGLEMELVCVNHWPIAIETHTKNHPLARHYCQDIATVRPHLLVPEGYLDLLMASPTCTHHSVARGGKPTSDQQRSDPWHIITWLTELRVKRLIIENVWEFIGWGPVDLRTGKPIKARKGEYFRAWIDTIRRLGFDPEWRKLNAADFGDATTRQRFILMARSDAKSVSWPIPTHRKVNEGRREFELFPTLKPWRPARDIIDWDIKGKSIFNRKKPLAAKTLARIHAGAVKFKWPEPFLVILRNHMAGQSVDQPVPTISAGGLHVGLAQPVIVNMKGQSTATDIDVPVPTQTAHAAHIYMADPIIVNGRKNNKAKGVSTEPVPTLDTKGGVWLAEPFVLSSQNSGQPLSAGSPLPTITTGGAGDASHPGCARPILIEPFILNRHGDNGSTRAHSTDEPIPTADCRGAGFVIEPFVLSRHGGGAPRAVEEPTPTQVAKHSHVLISPYYGSGSGETCSTVKTPLPTVTAKARFGMVVPVTHSQGGNLARDTETQPLPTLTTAKGGEFAIVVPITHAGGFDRVLDVNGDPLPTVTGANRGELAFIAAQFGEREGQAPRVHSIDGPTPAICASGHVNLIEATPQYDILFRMLEPHELAAAMGFDTDEAAYEFAGTKTEQVKQIGNAVSVAKMKACVGSIMADAAKKPGLAADPIQQKRAAQA
jgi:DNA (cytosine-5)-methyltransferase 1